MLASQPSNRRRLACAAFDDPYTAEREAVLHLSRGRLAKRSHVRSHQGRAGPCYAGARQRRCSAISALHVYHRETTRARAGAGYPRRALLSPGRVGMPTRAAASPARTCPRRAARQRRPRCRIGWSACPLVRAGARRAKRILGCRCPKLRRDRDTRCERTTLASPSRSPSEPSRTTVLAGLSAIAEVRSLKDGSQPRSVGHHRGRLCALSLVAAWGHVDCRYLCSALIDDSLCTGDLYGTEIEQRKDGHTT